MREQDRIGPHEAQTTIATSTLGVEIVKPGAPSTALNNRLLRFVEETWSATRLLIRKFADPNRQSVVKYRPHYGQVR